MSKSKNNNNTLAMNAFYHALEIQEYGYKAMRNNDGSKIFVESNGGHMSKLVLTHVAKKYGYKFDYKCNLYQTTLLNPDLFTVQLVLEYEGKAPQR